MVLLASVSAFRWRYLAAAVLAILLAATALLAPFPVQSHSTGMVGQTRSGCTCHNVTESLGVTPTLDGLPGYYEPGKEYDLNVSFEGGPIRGPGPRAGFDLRVTGGLLVAPEGSDQVRRDPGSGELTHTFEGNNATWWRVSWRAPEEDTGTVTFTLVVNAVNGDGVQRPGDQWGRVEVEVQEGGRGGISDAGAFWSVVAIAFVLAIIGGAWYATREPRIGHG